MEILRRKEGVVEVIPVVMQPEPSGFDTKVRKKGLRWLKSKKIPLHQKLLPGTEIKPYWRACLPDLHKSYDGICAYLSIFMEPALGAASTDHFIAKSQAAGQAYEWSNYRLACKDMNARKRDYDSVLDPIGLAQFTFRIVFLTGEIYPNPTLAGADLKAAQDTIEILGLDDPGCRAMRAAHYLDYSNKDISARFLKKRSPFVYLEIKRQGLL